jgi:hypothetical protein
MSSSRALRDVTNRNNGSYEASAVGEVNVVDLMKEQRHYRRGRKRRNNISSRIMIA